MIKRFRRFFIWMLVLGVAIPWIVRNTDKLIKLIEPILQQVSPPIFRLLIRNMEMPEVRSRLEGSGKRLASQLMKRHPSARNYEILSHLIGIENWGQKRLRVALNEPYVSGDYDPYRPEPGLSWNELQDRFESTRAQTLTLLDEITAEGNTQAVIWHNSFGAFDSKMWFVYLYYHAEAELWKMDR